MSDSVWPKLIVISLSVAVHIGALSYWAIAAQPIEMEAGAGAVQARIGSAFEDMAEGEMKPMTAEIPQADQPEAEPEAAEAAPTKTPKAETPQIKATEHTDGPTVDVAALPNQPVEVLTPTLPEITATESVAAPPAESMRPKPRDPKKVPEAMLRKPAPKPKPQPAKRATQAPKPEPKQQAPRTTQQGNAKQNNTQGSATGSQSATAKTQGTVGGSAKKSGGNASASNYPGKVMRKISRLGRPRVKNKGTATVRFTVAGSGGLASVSLARSSGSAELDRLAVSHIRRAAPFPPPPPGAQRSFSIQIKGR